MFWRTAFSINKEMNVVLRLIIIAGLYSFDSMTKKTCLYAGIPHCTALKEHKLEVFFNFFKLILMVPNGLGEEII
jgi:hypothetical protein